MLLLYATVSLFLFGSSAAVQHEVHCYGKYYAIPFQYKPHYFSGKLYLTPSNGGSRILLVENKKAKDPRIQLSYTSFRLTDLTGSDNGIISAIHDDGRQVDVVELKIDDCAPTVTRFYWDWYYYDVPQQAEILEFTTKLSDPPNVLWNRSDPQTNKGGRGKIGRNSWGIMDLTQKDNGYYILRKKDRSLLSIILLKVEENHMSFDKMAGESLIIRYPSVASSWNVHFTPEGDKEYLLLVAAGNLLTENNPHSEYAQFNGRVQLLHNGIKIDNLEIIHSGLFEFRDLQNNLALTVLLHVQPASPPTIVIVGIFAGIVFAAILCCCCVRKCCCKKRSSKRDVTAPQTAAAPQVYNHERNRPAGPSIPVESPPGYSYQPMNYAVSREPVASSLRPSAPNPVNVHVKPPQPEVEPLGGQERAPAPTFGSDCLSSDPEPRFHLKGMTNFAPPLSSDSTFSDVYTSDKLNFL